MHLVHTVAQVHVQKWVKKKQGEKSSLELINITKKILRHSNLYVSFITFWPLNVKKKKHLLFKKYFTSAINNTQRLKIFIPWTQKY